jgi:hypothetical protein
MQNARPTPTASSTRAPDVSLNMIPAPESSNMVISVVQSIPPTAQHVEKNAQISNLAPEQTGSLYLRLLQLLLETEMMNCSR